jgi:thymidylate synthase (FAD)
LTCDIDPQLIENVQFSSEMKVEYIDHLGSDLDIARAAWVSTMGERADEGDPNRVKGLINMLMRDRHGSPFEQGLLRFRVTAPIVVFREHHRHRIASYNEVSGRYVEMQPNFYVPPEIRPLIQTGKPGAYTFEPGSDGQYRITESAFRRMGYRAWTEYKSLLNNGIAKEVARMVLPLTTISTMIVAMNPRALMNFLSLRVKSEEARYPTFPMWEINQVANKYEEYFIDTFPDTWNAFNTNGRVAP